MTDDNATVPAGERIAKLLARAGLGSRRDVERMIAEGRVKLRGRPVAGPALNLASLEGVTVDGEAVGEPEPTRLWRYHKPRGLVVSNRDELGRDTIFDKLPPGMPRVVAVGRLDLNSEGLLLLTNDGELARRLELPATGWIRRYRVRAFGDPDPLALARLLQGVTLDGIAYGPIDARLERKQGDNVWLTVSLREGKNREIRFVLESLGLKVNRLIRLAFGPFQLGQLEPGAVAAVPRSVLKDQLGREPGEGRPAQAREPKPAHGKPRHGQRHPGAQRAERPGRTRPDRPGAEGPRHGKPERGRATRGDGAPAPHRPERARRDQPAGGPRQGRVRHEGGAADRAVEAEAPVRTVRHGKTRHAWPSATGAPAGGPRRDPARHERPSPDPAAAGEAPAYRSRRGAGRHVKPPYDPAARDKRPDDAARAGRADRPAQDRPGGPPSGHPGSRPPGRPRGGKPGHAHRRWPPPR